MVSPNFDLETLVGEDSNSWGISSTGQLSHERKVMETGRKLVNGDLVTISLNRKQGRLTFLINGKKVPQSFQESSLRTMDLYPAVTLRESHVMFSQAYTS